MSSEIPVTQRLLYRSARTHLGSIPNVRAALEETRRDRDGFNTRIREFEEVCQVLNQEVMSPDMSEHNYYNVLVLKELLKNNPFLTPGGIVRSKDRSLHDIAARTFQDVNDKSHDSGDEGWKFPNEVTDPHVLTSAFLIEGYGLFMENVYGKHSGEPKLGMTFVRAVEEVLWYEFPNSAMLKDVLPWMVEERNNFSVTMEEELRELAPEDSFSKEKEAILKRSPYLQALVGAQTPDDFFGQRVKQAVDPILRDIDKKLGENWLPPLLEGLRNKLAGDSIFAPDADNKVISAVIIKLILLGYEVQDPTKLHLFANEIMQELRFCIDMPAAGTIKGRDNQAKMVQTVLEQGIQLRKQLYPDTSPKI